ncbi:hypothetical protein PF007_g13672 [Phytophthora fragariae]|uniref:RxLR effector protein n=2 Tax=Phytophthora fragariae TaxID=53985 RepID=A0A6A3RYE2_9STRA|nr:hypothetical protein PF007_g13672 [Phytophthora fragariae]KAE9312603.1 hypothetical protein PF008_g19929 [Phytophthora fragariae]
MVRSKAAFILLTAIAATTSTQAIDWTFWNDDDDSTASSGSSTGLETLSPETLKSMMGSDYMDAVKSLISSGKGSAGSDSSADSDSTSATDAPTSSGSSSASDNSVVPSFTFSGSSSSDSVVPRVSAMASPSNASGKSDNVQVSVASGEGGAWRLSFLPWEGPVLVRMQVEMQDVYNAAGSVRDERMS